MLLILSLLVWTVNDHRMGGPYQLNPFPGLGSDADGNYPFSGAHRESGRLEDVQLLSKNYITPQFYKLTGVCRENVFMH